MTADIESWIVFPAWQAKVKRREHHSLEVAGNQRQLRLDKLDACFERYLALKHAYRGNVEGHALAFEVEKYCVAPGKAVISIIALHDGSPISCLISCRPQFVEKSTSYARISIHERKSRRELHQLEHFVDTDINPAQHDLDTSFTGQGRELFHRSERTRIDPAHGRKI